MEIKRSKNNKMNCGWHEIIEGTAHYYQSAFNTLKLVAQLSEYNDVLSKQIIAKSINGDFFLHSPNIRATAKSSVPKDSSVMITSSEKENEVDKQAEVKKQHTVLKRNENA